MAVYQAADSWTFEWKDYCYCVIVNGRHSNQNQELNSGCFLLQLIDKIKIRRIQASYGFHAAHILCIDALCSRSTIMETYVKSSLENNLEAKTCGRPQIFFSWLPCQTVSGWICPIFTALQERRLLNLSWKCCSSSYFTVKTINYSIMIKVFH